MSFTKIIFQKELKDLTREDLETFFSEEQEETPNLEFKEGITDLKKIHSEVAAFLNTDGGLLILGAPREIEHPTKKGYKIAQGALTPSLVRDKDVVSRSIGTGIAPAPTSIRIHSVEIEGGAVYLIEVAPSLNPPHQVSDSGKYYIRFEREAKAAPHGLVEAMFFRRQAPVLNVDVKTVRTEFKSDASMSVHLQFNNSSRFTAHNFGYGVTFLYVSDVFQTIKGESLTVENECATFDEYLGERIIVKGMKLASKFNVVFSGPVIGIIVSVYAKDCQLETYHYVINSGGQVSYADRSEEGADKPQEEYGECFARENKDAFLSVLGNPPSQDLIPAITPREKLMVLAKMGVRLPDSFSFFYAILNGYQGPVGNLVVRIYDIDTLLNPGNLEVFSKDSYRLRIGTIELSYLSIYCRKGRYSYNLQYQIGTQLHDVILSNGFWGMLNLLRSHNTSSHFNIK